MGEAGHVYPKFRRALERGQFEIARMLAFELPRVPLADAAALTLLAAERRPAKFEPMARRWMARLIAEADPPLGDLASAVWLLEDVRLGRLLPEKALAPLERVAEGKRLG
jgi:hypothetical protein